MYTSGVWIVQEGREEEFVRSGQRNADVVSLAVPGVTFALLRDADDPRRFVSVCNGWRNREQIAEARSSPEFLETMAAVERCLERNEFSVLELAAEVS